MKKIIVASFISFVLTLFLPLLVLSLIKSDAAMAICFILFFIVYPLLSIGMGTFAGTNCKKNWVISILPAVSFLLFVIIVNPAEVLFYIYFLIYLTLGLLAMFCFNCWLKHMSKKQLNNK